MKAYAVIGAGFGDCGKGATVDQIASSVENPVVIRFNGGAQAGHTVELPDGRRHVFSHFGSGALAGAPTHLSKYFVVNPRSFLNEWVELAALGGNTNISIHPDALVTTPYDVSLNRYLERTRGDKCHGSVGIGFGATVERSLKGPKLTIGDLLTSSESRIKMLLKAVEQYTNNTANVTTLGVNHNDFFKELRMMKDLVSIDQLVFRTRDTYIFEGAQGLLLDQDTGYTFPHLTRSNTGLKNVVALINGSPDGSGAWIRSLDVSYVTRCYSTRHGAGPLDGEELSGKLMGIDVIDHTNKEKPWQGKFRLAPLMLPRVRDAILNDLKQHKLLNPGVVRPGVVVTCMDQVTTESHRNIIRGALRTNLPGMSILERHGPRRGDLDEKTTVRKSSPLSTRPESIFLEATESPAAAAERFLRVTRTKPSDPS